MQPIATPVQPVEQAPMMPLGAGSAGPSSMQETGRDPTAELMKQMTPDQQMTFQERINGMPPAERMNFIKKFATEFGMAAGDASDDMTRADALRQGAPTSGGAVGPSGVYVGSSPLEHIAQVMNNKKRETEYDTAKTARTDARAAQDDRNVEMMGMTLPGMLRQNL
jgi:hypothetical protein